MKMFSRLFCAAATFLLLGIGPLWLVGAENTAGKPDEFETALRRKAADYAANVLDVSDEGPPATLSRGEQRKATMIRFRFASSACWPRKALTFVAAGRYK